MPLDFDDTSFKWPECPPWPASDWFLVAGAELGLTVDQIRFAAALLNLGGPDSRNNSMAARLAGMELSRTEAYRMARSVKVRRLVDAADAIKTGKHKPISEEEINQRIDKMIRSQNDQWAARGIELHERRMERRRQEQASGGTDIRQELRELEEISPGLAAEYCRHKGISYPLPATDDAIQLTNGVDKSEDADVAAE
jgi:hypothetical protein